MYSSALVLHCIIPTDKIVHDFTMYRYDADYKHKVNYSCTVEVTFDCILVKVFE